MTSSKARMTKDPISRPRRSRCGRSGVGSWPGSAPVSSPLPPLAPGWSSSGQMVRPRVASASSSRTGDDAPDPPPGVGRSSAEGPEALVRSDIAVMVGAPVGGRTQQGLIVIKLALRRGQPVVRAAFGDRIIDFQRGRLAGHAQGTGPPADAPAAAGARGRANPRACDA
jgi:hypothetical protein